MYLLRRHLLALISVLLMVGLVAGCGSSPSSAPAAGSGSSDSAAKNPIKLGVLEDQSGDFAIVGIQKYHAALLAVDEINKAGGLLGRQIQVIAPDTQSDNKRFQEMSRKLILEDKVDVIMGAFSSASREAIRPIMDQNKMLYFYNNQYEGGVCDNTVFATGLVPEQQVNTMMPWMIKKFGPKIYTIAADYNFGQITAKWVRMVSEKNGGQIVGEEFIPLDTSQFSATIDRIQKAKPDVLVVLLVGAKQASFYEQWATAGIKGLPLATTNNVSQSYEHKRFKPPALANMYTTAGFMEELDTPQAKAFVDKWHKMFPNEPYIAMEGETQYTGVYLWAEAVKKAGTTDRDKVIKALESGLSFDGPGGKVTIDPKTHQAIRTVYLVKVDDQHKLSFPEKWDNVKPDWLSTEKGCNLPEKQDATQYVPITTK